MYPTLNDTFAASLFAVQDPVMHALIVRVNWAIDHDDLETLLSCLHLDVVFIRPDGQILQGSHRARDAYAQREPARITRHHLSHLHLSWSSPDPVKACDTVLLWVERMCDNPTSGGQPADAVQKLGEHRDVWGLENGHWRLLKQQVVAGEPIFTH